MASTVTVEYIGDDRTIDGGRTFGPFNADNDNLNGPWEPGEQREVSKGQAEMLIGSLPRSFRYPKSKTDQGAKEKK